MVPLHGVQPGLFRLEAGLDCQSILSELRERGAAIVFNLVESLAGSDALIHLFPGLFENALIPFTGSSSAALFLTSNKIIAKRLMSAAGIPTPDYIDLSLQDSAAFLILPDGCGAVAGASVELHQQALCWLVQRVERQPTPGMVDSGCVVLTAGQSQG